MGMLVVNSSKKWTQRRVDAPLHGVALAAVLRAEDLQAFLQEKHLTAAEFSDCVMQVQQKRAALPAGSPQLAEMGLLSDPVALGFAEKCWHAKAYDDAFRSTYWELKSRGHMDGVARHAHREASLQLCAFLRSECALSEAQARLLMDAEEINIRAEMKTGIAAGWR